MCTLTTISIHDNLTTCQTGISMRTTDNKLTCRIDEILDVIIEKRQYLVAQLCFHAWDENVDNILTNLSQHSIVIIITHCILDKIIMLSRNNDCINTLRNIVIRVFYRYLTLGIRTEISHYLTFLTDSSEFLHDKLCQVKRDWHIIICLIGSIAEHHTLVTSTLVFIFLTAHTTVDIITLLMNGSKNTTRVTIKLVF